MVARMSARCCSTSNSSPGLVCAGAGCERFGGFVTRGDTAGAWLTVGLRRWIGRGLASRSAFSWAFTARTRSHVFRAASARAASALIGLPSWSATCSSAAQVHTASQFARRSRQVSVKASWCSYRSQKSGLRALSRRIVNGKAGAFFRMTGPCPPRLRTARGVGW